MKTQLEELLIILKQEVDHHEMLMDLLQEESDGFGILSASMMLRIQSRKLQQTRLIAKLETRRIAVVEELSGPFEEESDSLSLSVIIRKAPQEWASPLQMCFDQLKKLINEIRNAAEKNGEQSASRLKSIQTTLHFFSKMQGAQQLYSENGQLHSADSKISRASV
jgi:flagellar biosynthesis/type III secretory pathway chaperone